MRAILIILLTLFFIGYGSGSGGEHSSFNVSNISPLIDVNDTYLTITGELLFRVTSDASKNFFTGTGKGNIEPQWKISI